jgi:hypothetical protein
VRSILSPQIILSPQSILFPKVLGIYGYYNEREGEAYFQIDSILLPLEKNDL